MKGFKLQKPKKMSTKIVLLSGIILLVLNVLLGAASSIATGRGLNIKQNAFLLQTSDNAMHQVTEHIQKYTVVTEMLAQDPEIISAISSSSAEFPYSSQPNYRQLTDLLQATTQRYPDLLGMGVGVVDEGKIYTKDGKVVTDIESLPLYQAVTENRLVVTQPFMNPVTNTYNISICDPITIGGKVAGFVTVNIGLDSLSEFSTDLSFGETGSVILLSNDNIVMGYNNASLIGQNFTDIEMTSNLAQELSSPSGQVLQYTISGQTRTGVITQIPDYNWKMIVGMSSAEYNAQTDKTVLWMLFMLMTVTIIVAVWLRFIIVKNLRPLSQINEGLKEMSKGNLKVSITHSGEDEIGEMAESMRSCISTLSSYVTEIDFIMGKLASGDLTVKSSLEFKGDFIPIQHSISQFIKNLTYLMSNISQASDQVSAGSEQISYGSQALAQGATEQADSVSELVSTINQLSETIQSNAEMAQTASENANGVNDEIAESGKKMTQSLEMMEEIRSSANKVSGIIKTIDDIAFQTNILALNAAVEAARAGQAGKGFAVVADEVRSLAAKSAEASKATTELINTMLKAIQNGSESVRDTKQYMDNVVTAASEITSIFQKISAASDGQANSIALVTQETNHISDVVQNNSAAAEQSASASQELSSQAEMLRNLISQFKIEQPNFYPDMSSVDTSSGDSSISSADYNDFSDNGKY